MQRIHLSSSVCLSCVLAVTLVLAPPSLQSQHGWERSTPQAQGVDAQVLADIHQDILNGDYGLIDQFLVIRNGKIIADHAYHQDYVSIAAQYDTTNHQYNYDHPAWHPFYQETRLHSLQSVTKSITSALVGIAIDEGLISGTDLEIMTLFADQTDLSDPRKRAMTLEDLLTMRSGITWDEANYNNADNSCILMEGNEDWIQFVLDHPMDTEPGTVFEYNSGASVLIGKVLSIKTGMSVTEWAEKKLFGPLGISDYYWKKTPLDETDTEGGLYLTAHDLAKIGQLFLQKGKWQGKRIISERWVARSTSPVIADVNPHDHRMTGYGYQWWVPKHRDGQAIIFAGNGYGGQFLMVAPDYDLIVIFNGWEIHSRPAKSSWMALDQRILPTITE